MSRTEHELRAMYADLDADPAAEVRLREWLDDVAAPTRDRGPSRHRWAVIASAAAVGLVVVGAAALAGSRSHHGVPAGSSATAGPSSGTVARSPEVAPTPQVIARTLLGLLPRRGSVSGLSGVTIDKHPQAEFVYDDGHGAARLALSLDLPSAGLPSNQCLARQPDCEVLPDGTVVGWRTQSEQPTPVVGQMWTAYASHPDGLIVTVTEYTSAVPKVGPVTRAEPPFTVDELKAIVGSPRWQPTVTVDVAQQDAELFTPKPDTTTAAVPSSTDDAKPESYAPPSGSR
jgi:hypothetical protein